MSHGKWVAGGIGWLHAGPIGGIIGFVIGYIFDYFEKDDTQESSEAHFENTKQDDYYFETDDTKEASDSYYQNTVQDFDMSLLVLFACIIKADGKVVKSEIEYIKRFFVDLNGVKQAQEAMNLLKEILQQSIDEIVAAQQIHAHLSHSAKLELLYLFFELAFVDRALHHREQDTIKRIANVFNVSDAEFNSIKAQFLDQKEENWAYKVLDLSPRVSNDEIKAAYKKLAIKYHPDKVAYLGDEAKRIATEKFKIINDAYDFLRKDRGFV